MPMAVFGSTKSSDPQDQRFQSCLEFLRQTKEREIPVFLADASPNRDATEQLRQFAHVTDVRGATMQAQKATALHHANESGARVLIHTEIEKSDLVRFLEEIAEPILTGSSDLVIPKRSEVSWASYPGEMRWIEGFALDAIRAVTGHRWDLMFGPFAIERELAQQFLDCTAPNWSWLHKPRLQIIHEALWGVREIEVDFLYPPSQLAAEEGNTSFLHKRFEQLEFILGPLREVFQTA